MSHTQIRGSFIRGYAEKHRAYWEAGSGLIQQRNDEHRALNRAYGYIDKNGVVPIGCKSHVDREYKRRYDDIEARFRLSYERGLPDLYDWCKGERVSVFEYLWIDNIHGESLEAIVLESVGKAEWQMNYVARKAALLLERLKGSGNPPVFGGSLA